MSGNRLKGECKYYIELSGIALAALTCFLMFGCGSSPPAAGPGTPGAPATPGIPAGPGSSPAMGNMPSAPGMPAGTPGDPNAGGANPADVTTQLVDVTVLANMQRMNPFTSLIAPPVLPEVIPTQDPNLPTGTPIDPTMTQAPPSVEEVPPPPADPFEGVSLSGIVYRGAKSLAIVTMPDGKSKILHSGESFSTGGEDPAVIRIGRIDRKQVSMRVIEASGDLPAEMKTRVMKIGSLVGYQSKAGTGGQGNRRAVDTASPAGQNAEGVPPEIQALMNGGGNANPPAGPGGAPARPGQANR